MFRNFSFFVVFISIMILDRGCDGILSWLEPTPPPKKEVVLYTNKLYYNATENVVVTLKNNGSTPVFLPGCSPFSIADKNDSGWVAHPLYVCVWEGFAKKIDPGGTYQETFAAAPFVGWHKMFTTVYWECKDGLPISQAECREEKRIASAEFYVKPLPKPIQIH